ncbi:hypothetical protein Tco_0714520 [Tanacetum coccineum]
MAEGLSARMLMEHQDDQGVSLFTNWAWRRLFDIKGPLVHKLILEFYSTFRFGQAILDLDTSRTLQFQLGGARRRMSWRNLFLTLGLHTNEEMQTARFNFLGTTPSYTMIQDPILRLCYRLIAYSITRRSQAPEKAWRGHGTEEAGSMLQLEPAVDEGCFYYCEECAQRLGRIEEVCKDAQSVGSYVDLLDEMMRIKPGSKFSTIVHEYDMKPSRTFTLNASIDKRDDFKCVEAEEKSNLKTSL